MRGTPLDLFGWSSERRLERQLRADYEKLLDEIAAELTAENYESAVALAALPEKIRGFGHVKLRSVEAAKAEEARCSRGSAPRACRSPSSWRPNKAAAPVQSAFFL